MFLCDTHVHTCFSFDSEMLHGELCGEYIRRGFTSVALTDHYDIDGIESGIYPSYDVKNARIAYERASEEYAGQLDLIWGIELGQPTLRPENTCKFIRENGFEFVIGSVHNLDLVPDFIFMNFSRMPQELIEQLYSKYVDLLCETAAFGKIDTLAHITYPMRYIHRDGRDLDLRVFYGKYGELFRIMKENGVALELNTSGIRKGYVTSPDTDLLMLYRDCGGERVTCGSDAHRIQDCGADVPECLELLRSCGFTSLVIPTHNKTELIRL